MTEPEAAQIILEGNKREACKRCYGTGLVIAYNDIETQVQCRTCRGMGATLRFEYVQALNRLDMSEP